MALSTAGVDIEDGTGAGARTSRVRLVITEPWWARLLRCCSYLAHYATRMQRARFTRPGHKASGAIGVGVPAVHQSRGAPFLHKTRDQRGETTAFPLLVKSSLFN